eukprot:GGOE01006717.1.p4 GENE.GGOE01006717.1~~GGOE01006717.1.p4  ORF type:complete len:114 (-),score=1.56 GGOE01006717.1:539-880(-)
MNGASTHLPNHLFHVVPLAPSQARYLVSAGAPCLSRHGPQLSSPPPSFSFCHCMRGCRTPPTVRPPQQAAVLYTCTAGPILVANPSPTHRPIASVAVLKRGRPPIGNGQGATN